MYDHISVCCKEPLDRQVTSFSFLTGQIYYTNLLQLNPCFGLYRAIKQIRLRMSIKVLLVARGP